MSEEGEAVALDEFIHESVMSVMGQRASVIEERIRILLQPKPRWLPESVWKRIVGRLLTIEYRDHAAR